MVKSSPLLAPLVFRAAYSARERDAGELTDRLEQKREFPQRFYLTPRCVFWPLAEVLEWIDAQRRKGREVCGPHPDYRMRSANGMSGGQ